MLDDLRQQAGDSFEDGSEEQDAFALREEKRRPRGNFLGMSPIQRLILSVMLFAMTCVMGLFVLIVLERIYLPF